ncbi:hypothetical protein [Thauera humireducens]
MQAIDRRGSSARVHLAMPKLNGFPCATTSAPPHR